MLHLQHMLLKVGKGNRGEIEACLYYGRFSSVRKDIYHFRFILSSTQYMPSIKLVSVSIAYKSLFSPSTGKKMSENTHLNYWFRARAFHATRQRSTRSCNQCLIFHRFYDLGNCRWGFWHQWNSASVTIGWSHDKGKQLPTFDFKTIGAIKASNRVLYLTNILPDVFATNSLDQKIRAANILTVWYPIGYGISHEPEVSDRLSSDRLTTHLNGWAQFWVDHRYRVRSEVGIHQTQYYNITKVNQTNPK